MISLIIIALIIIGIMSLIGIIALALIAEPLAIIAAFGVALFVYIKGRDNVDIVKNDDTNSMIWLIIGIIAGLFIWQTFTNLLVLGVIGGIFYFLITMSTTIASFVNIIKEMQSE